VVVWRGASLAIWEVHATIDAATRRSCELWSILVRNGWHSTDERAPGLVPGRESYRRGCPECRARAGVVTYRRHGYIVLFCEQCEHGWTDRERTAQGALQAPVLPPHRERRRVA
jgi:hypothetical protein